MYIVQEAEIQISGSLCIEKSYGGWIKGFPEAGTINL